jgi:hypothetical protein
MQAHAGDELTIRSRHQGDEDRHGTTIGRSVITALDAGHVPPFGEIGTEGASCTAGDGT